MIYVAAKRLKDGQLHTDTARVTHVSAYSGRQARPPPESRRKIPEISLLPGVPRGDLRVSPLLVLFPEKNAIRYLRRAVDVPKIQGQRVRLWPPLTRGMTSSDIKARFFLGKIGREKSCSIGPCYHMPPPGLMPIAEYVCQSGIIHTQPWKLGVKLIPTWGSTVIWYPWPQLGPLLRLRVISDTPWARQGAKDAIGAETEEGPIGRD